MNKTPHTTAPDTFDYQVLAPDDQTLLRAAAEEIRSLARTTIDAVLTIGRRLLEVKNHVGHGHFGAWLRTEFAWSERQAERYMTVAERFTSDNLSDLTIDISALYLLAARSTPEAARAEAVQRARAGEPITHTVARELVDAHCTAPQQQEQAQEDAGDEGTEAGADSSAAAQTRSGEEEAKDEPEEDDSPKATTSTKQRVERGKGGDGLWQHLQQVLTHTDGWDNAQAAAWIEAQATRHRWDWSARRELAKQLKRLSRLLPAMADRLEPRKSGKE